MSREEAMNIYSDLQQSVINVLKRDLPEQESKAGVFKPKPQDSWLRGMLGVMGVLALARGSLTALGLLGVVELSPAQAKIVTAKPMVITAETRSERELFDNLERARSILEKRRVQLDDRESTLEVQEEKLAIRLAELRQLTAELRSKRQAADAKRDTQLEQLANVYVSMKPSEAARLLQELDTMIALDLIKKMPEKRIGQLLSMMEPEKALVMTRLLTGTSQR